MQRPQEIKPSPQLARFIDLIMGALHEAEGLESATWKLYRKGSFPRSILVVTVTIGSAILGNKSQHGASLTMPTDAELEKTPGEALELAALDTAAKLCASIETELQKYRSPLIIRPGQA